MKIIDHSDKVKEALEDQLESALEEIGLRMERHAKLALTAQDAVDTGRLRNSISHATASNVNDKKYRWTKSTKGRGTPAGKDTTEPRSKPEKFTAVVGTNVEYAQHIELGTSKMSPRPYLKPAVSNHLDEYKQIIKEKLKDD